jgi:RNA polymerase sigma factor (sigma-70 family)
LDDRTLSTLLGQLHRVLEPTRDRAATDAQLLERFVRTRDEAAFELLVRRHGGLVLGVCRRILRQPQDAEDAFQATFLALVRKASTIAKHDSVAGWLYRVAYRAAREAKTRAARRTEREARAGVRAAPDPASEVAWRDLAPVLDEQVARLPELFRTPFVLCCLEGHSLDEVAHLLGCPRATVGTRVARAKERLRGRLLRRGLSLSTAMPAVSSGVGVFPALPEGAARGTALAARRLAAGEAAGAGAPPDRVVSLADAALRTGWHTKTVFLAGALLLAAFVATGVVTGRPGGTTRTAAAGGPSPATREPGFPRGWFGWSTRPDAFEVGTDRTTAHGGGASAYVRLREQGGEARAYLNQAVQAAAFRGERLCLSAWLKMADTGRAGLWMRVDGPDQTLALDRMERRPAEGAGDWRRYQVVLDVPPNATEICFGLWLNGPGQVWADDFALDAVSADVPSTNELPRPVPLDNLPSNPPPRPANLGFEDAPARRDDRAHAKDWVQFPSRETGGGPSLQVSREGGASECHGPSADAVVLADLPHTVWGQSPTLALSLGDTARVLLRFDVPDGAPVRRAELVLPLGLSKRPPNAPFELGVHETLAPWDEAEVTWDAQPAWDETPAASALVDPRAREARIDVTRLLSRAGRGPCRHGWLLKVCRPVPSEKPASVVRGDVLKLLPWEESVARALQQARREGKLVLACVRANPADGREPRGEQMLLATALADPDVLALVRSRFVPVRVPARPRGRSEARPARPAVADPVERLHDELSRTAPTTLLAAYPDGEPAGRLGCPNAFDRDLLLRFLTESLAREPTPAAPAGPWTLLASGRLDEARQRFAALGSRAGLYGSCRVASLQGDHGLALELAECLAAEGGPYAHEARYEVGHALMRQGRFAEAAAAFRRVLSGPAGPRSADARYYLGCLLYRAGDREEARALWQAVSADAPGSPVGVRAGVRLEVPVLMATSERLRSAGPPGAPAPPVPAERAARPADGAGKLG